MAIVRPEGFLVRLVRNKLEIIWEQVVVGRQLREKTEENHDKYVRVSNLRILRRNFLNEHQEYWQF
jgi:hypothetical protein